MTSKLNFMCKIGVCELVVFHTCILDISAVLQAFIGVVISGSEGCVHADDVTMLTGLDSLHTVSLS